MNDLTPDPKDFEEDHFPVRGNSWLANSLGEIAQVKAVYAEKDYRDPDGTERRRFFADLVFYEASGLRIGRKSINPPSMIAGEMHRGPRNFDPFCSLEGWYRIEPPQFPLEREMVSYPHPEDPTKRRLSMEWAVTPKAWGNYAKRKRRAMPVAVVQVHPNLDAELERRARKLAAALLRDKARETGNQSLREVAIELEKEAEQF